MKKTILFLLFMLVIPFLAESQTEQFKFRHYGVEEGAHTDGYYGIAQDSKGYIWMASEVGLIKYDGRTFKGMTNNAKGLNITACFDVAVDNQDRVWATGAGGGGLLLYE
jgi:ligand-binding sensor domain-containing protein